MFVGSSDQLATVLDNQWAKTQLTKVLKFYKEYALGHLSFMIAKDMSYFKDVFNMLNEYHPVASSPVAFLE
jgi:hypothetical protein